jgi:hypothetical protein
MTGMASPVLPNRLYRMALFIAPLPPGRNPAFPVCSGAVRAPHFPATRRRAILAAYSPGFNHHANFYLKKSAFLLVIVRVSSKLCQIEQKTGETRPPDALHSGLVLLSLRIKRPIRN